MIECFTIIDNLASTEDQVKVARAILLAQDIKEDSQKSNQEAANIAVAYVLLPTFWCSIIHGLNTVMWNESQDWAKGILNIRSGNAS